MVDTPRQLNKLPPQITKESIVSGYNKDLLMYAAHMNNYDAVKYFIENNWPINSRYNIEKNDNCGSKVQRFNSRVLTYAAENASIELIKLLVSAGADTSIKDSQGNILDYYISLNPRFSAEEKQLGFKKLLSQYYWIGREKFIPVCNTEKSAIDQAVCNSQGLSIYERELERNYTTAIHHSRVGNHLKVSQLQWYKKRNEECATFSDGYLNACIARLTRARIRYLEYIRATMH